MLRVEQPHHLLLLSIIGSFFYPPYYPTVVHNISQTIYNFDQRLSAVNAGVPHHSLDQSTTSHAKIWMNYYLSTVIASDIHAPVDNCQPGPNEWLKYKVDPNIHHDYDDIQKRKKKKVFKKVNQELRSNLVRGERLIFIHFTLTCSSHEQLSRVGGLIFQYLNLFSSKAATTEWASVLWAVVLQ